MWRGQVALRAGYRGELGATSSERLSGPTFGFGTGVGTMWMDYGFAVNGADGTGQPRLGLTFRPGAIFAGPVAAQPIAAPREREPARVHVARQAPPEKAPAPMKQAAPAKQAAPVAPAPEASPAVTPGPMPVMPPAPTHTEPAPPAAATPAPASVQERPTTVVLGAGETLADLARRWDTSVPAIMMLNNLVSERARPGTKLKLPPPNRR
jgi:LysM repeat protein